MNQKYFKYESKNHKKIRVKDILMLLSIFTFCIITVIVTGNSVNKNKPAVKVETAKFDNDIAIDTADAEYVLSSKKVDEITENKPVDASDADVVLEFVKPVDGGILKPFSPDNLLYSETMDDWRTHMGVDISCSYGTPIAACESGTIKSVEYDINFGNTVTLQCGEYEILYSSLSSEMEVTEGETISKGSVIGKSAETCIAEICDEPHIHFEVKKNGIYINPMDVISFN